MNFPAVKAFDMIVGIDVHAVIGVPVHPYLGPIYLWTTPKFPMSTVTINGMTACTVGAMGYSVHIPQGIPLPPTIPNAPYWTRYLTNIAMGICLMGLTVAANIAIAMIASLIPKPKSVEKFIKDLTGIDTTNEASTWNSISKSFSSFTKWQTWVKLLMPPIPFPGAQGSTTVGSPNVTANGGPIAFVAPLMAASCSDIPIVPNAAPLGFSNVMVGVNFADMVRGLAISTIQAGMTHGMKKGLGKLPLRRKGSC